LRRFQRSLLELLRANIAQARMTPPILSNLDKSKHLPTGHFSCGEARPVDQFLLQRSKGTLHDRVIIAIALSTHAADYCRRVQCLLKSRAGVLTSPVASKIMTRQPLWLRETGCPTKEGLWNLAASWGRVKPAQACSSPAPARRWSKKSLSPQSPHIYREGGV